jgi:spore coat polysaccharide biosynthesis predicted glycosyltransferase SpsG
MNVAFHYESGAIKEVGLGHHYRTRILESELKRRGHKLVNADQCSVLIVDHVHPQRDVILAHKARGACVVLIDGAPEDTELVDLSISAVVNRKAQLTGLQYLIIPQLRGFSRYSPRTQSSTVFVSMGGYDYNDYTSLAVKAITTLGFKALVTKSLDRKPPRQSNVGVFNEQDYYTAMKECVAAITNGGLTMFQALHYGMPTIPLPQYDHQKDNIRSVNVCCVPAEPTEQDLTEKLKWVMQAENYRESLSVLAKHFVGGDGVYRVCDAIEAAQR